jgi:hypothetical protein
MKHSPSHAIAANKSKAPQKPKAPRKTGVSRKRGAKRQYTQTAHKSTPLTLDISRYRLLATLLVAAAFIAGIYSLAKVDPRSTPPEYIDNTGNAKLLDAVNDNAPINARTEAISGYSFYVKLKDFSIDVPKGDFSKAADSFSNEIYLIQTGSFKTAERAERQVVQLKLLGLEPEVKDHINSNGNRWFRVTVGPYHSRSKMASARSSIISNGIDASVMKRKL